MNTAARHTAFDVQNWFLAWTSDDEDASIGITKLQKLLYYAQGYSLVKLGYPLFGDEIRAYEHGPVVKKVWKNAPAKLPNEEFKPLKLEVDFDFSTFTLDESQILADVWETFGAHSARYLSHKTHKDKPWIEAWARAQNNEDDLISKFDLTQYFSASLYANFLETEQGEELASYIRAA
jgi:uncharacterized phage-associated protein